MGVGEGPSRLQTVARLSKPVVILTNPNSKGASIVIREATCVVGRKGVPTSSVLIMAFSETTTARVGRQFLGFIKRGEDRIAFKAFRKVFCKVLGTTCRLDTTGVLSRRRGFDVLHRVARGCKRRVTRRKSFVRRITERVDIMGKGYVSPRRCCTSYYSSRVFESVFRNCGRTLGTGHGLSFSSVVLYYCRLFSRERSVLGT